MLRIESLNVSYSYLQVLWDVSLHVDRGEFVTLVGSNGAGKTTLVSTLFGLIPVSKGRIEFEGKDITGLAPFEIVRRGLSLVPEKRELFPRMTVRETWNSGPLQPGGGWTLTAYLTYSPTLPNGRTRTPVHYLGRTTDARDCPLPDVGPEDDRS